MDKIVRGESKKTIEREAQRGDNIKRKKYYIVKVNI
jgi:hypothetical protein